MNKFIFDVDGTLTPSRQTMDKEFCKWFVEFCKSNDVYLVTGSDYAKTLEQVGEDVCMNVKRLYNCSGSDVYEKCINVRTSEWAAPKELYDLMNGWLQSSPFKLRTGNHIEERPGMINFSIVGRNATTDERKLYIKHDLESRERESIAFQINLEFPNIRATVGGETGIDIGQLNSDKGQILADFDASDKILFFGDKMEQGGNDYPLANLLTHPSRSYNVKNWQDTWRLLNENIANRT